MARSAERAHAGHGSKYGFTVDARPIAEDALVAIFPTGKMGFCGKASGEIESQAGVVLESEGQGAGFGAAVELDIFYDLAPGFRKVEGFLGAPRMTIGGSRIVGRGLVSFRGAADLVPSLSGTAASIRMTSGYPTIVASGCFH